MCPSERIGHKLSNLYTTEPLHWVHVARQQYQVHSVLIKQYLMRGIAGSAALWLRPHHVSDNI